jgi:ribonuclease VapC
MILDSSALLAILKGERERDRFSETILNESSVAISAPTLLEVALVIEGQTGDKGRRDLDELVVEIDPQIIAFTAEQLSLARQAFREFGKGRHPARLNFGDCMAYALAKERGEPLLFKGTDFSQTDIEVAPY